MSRLLALSLVASLLAGCGSRSNPDGASASATGAVSTTSSAPPVANPASAQTASDPVMNAKPDPAGEPSAAAAATATTTTPEAPAQVAKTDEEWRRILTPEQYYVLRKAGTERAFGPAYEEFKKQGEGTYQCAGCGAELFSSKEKFDSHCGWPSFYDPANAKNVKTRQDLSHGMVRTEVICAVCDGHLGHVFTGEGFDTPTDKRYCINAVSLKFVPAGEKPDENRP